jgi:hypothetical protein
VSDELTSHMMLHYVLLHRMLHYVLLHRMLHESQD